MARINRRFSDFNDPATFFEAQLSHGFLWRNAMPMSWPGNEIP
jgi:hypothetical protein